MSKKTKEMTKEQQAAALQTWSSLNDALRSASEAEALAMLKTEQGSAKRLQYMMRCHARFNKLRGQRERAELLG